MDVLKSQFKDPAQLLDVIDGLRSQGLSKYISLPQLIVCGDQSSGKSSVLEAISRVAFPTKDTLCTRFATELVLRNDASDRVRVTIFPDPNRPEEEKEALRRFKVPNATLKDLGSLVDMASDAMGLNKDKRAFSKDVLRMELSGPDQPHLTLVDLPGLFHAESKQQSDQDAELVKSLVREYMANPRSVILAVVSAKNDYANQVVTKFAREFDPKGLRTLGIITKPDTLHVGSESEAAYLGLARNEDVQFRLGWHVLRNRDFDTRHMSGEERDAAERDFFATGVWQTLPLDTLGVDSLRPRLSDVLKEQIVTELPELIRDIETGLAESRNRLRNLGEPRGTLHQQRLYLVRISEAVSSLLRSASDGVYDRDFFGASDTDVGFKKRLRATIQHLLLDYTETMRMHGHYEQLINDDDEDLHSHVVNGIDKGMKEMHRPERAIPRSEYMRKVGDLMRRTRGRELPGTFNPMIIGDLFYAQSQPWSHLTHTAMDQIVAAARTTVELVLTHCADATTAEALLREIVNPRLEVCTEALRSKVEEILKPHRKGHPITYNHYFTDTIRKARRDHTIHQQSKVLHAFLDNKPQAFGRSIEKNTVDIEKLLEALNPETEEDMDQFACSEAMNCMEAYYKVALKALVDNFAVLGVELCLLQGLTDVLSAQVVMRLDDEMVQKIAAENPNSVSERTRIEEKVKVLDEGLRTLSRYRRFVPKESEREDLTASSRVGHDGIGVQSTHQGLDDMERKALTTSPSETRDEPPPQSTPTPEVDRRSGTAISKFQARYALPSTEGKPLEAGLVAEETPPAPKIAAEGGFKWKDANVISQDDELFAFKPTKTPVKRNVGH